MTTGLAMAKLKSRTLLLNQATNTKAKRAGRQLPRQGRPRAASDRRISQRTAPM